MRHASSHRIERSRWTTSMPAPTPHWSAHDARATAISPEDPLASALHAVGCRVFDFHRGLVASGNTQFPFEGCEENSGAVPEGRAVGLQRLLGAVGGCVGASRSCFCACMRLLCDCRPWMILVGPQRTIHSRYSICSELPIFHEGYRLISL